MNIEVRKLSSNDIPPLVEQFRLHNWNKPSSLFEAYLKEQEKGTRLVWLALVNNQVAGYVTLSLESKYQSFKDNKIPEIMDLNVLPPYRNQGVGTALLDHAEKIASDFKGEVGIGVGLYRGHDGGYGSAQKLYVKRGYVPDGQGITYDYKPVIPGDSYPVDDDLILWFTKKLG